MQTSPQIIPRSIPEYLEQLRAALGNADPAVIQDALFDAEDYLRSAIKEKVGRTEAEAIAEVATSYGNPEEVAEIYRDQEVTVSKAIAPPKPKQHNSVLGKFFGVIADPRAYSALFYMLLSLATGIFYFTWAVAGVSLSLGLSILIIGLPFVMLFVGTIYMFSLLEGRIVETLLGVRMPRRPSTTAKVDGLFNKFIAVVKDPHTWGTLLYMVLMMPLGVIYFTFGVVAITVSLALIFGGVWQSLVAIGLVSPYFMGHLFVIQWFNSPVPNGFAPLIALIGLVLFFVSLHVAKWIGVLHGHIAKSMLVRRAD